MSILTSLGQAVQAIESKLTGDKGTLSPVSFSFYTDSATKFLEQVRLSLTNPDVKEALATLFVKNPAPSGQFHVDRQSYDDLVNLLPNLYARSAKQDPAAFLIAGLDRIIPALQELSDKSTQVLPHGGVSETGDVRLSTALVLSYIDQAIGYGQWCAFAIDHALGLVEKDTLIIPRYTYVYIADHVPQLARFYQEVMALGNDRVVKNTAKLKVTAGDVTDSDTQGVAASHRSDNNYSGWEQGMADGIIRNPISMYYTMKENYRLGRIDTLRNRTNWLKERMSLLSSRNMNLSPTSPEYKKNHDAVQHYSNLVTDYDRKIMALS